MLATPRSALKDDRLGKLQSMSEVERCTRDGSSTVCAEQRALTFLLAFGCVPMTMTASDLDCYIVLICTTKAK
jgi:hypothetical protein